MFRLTSTLLCLAGLGTVASAADMPAYNDLRLSLGSESGAFESSASAELNGFKIEQNEKDDFDSTVTGSLQYVGSRGLGPTGGFVYGAGLHFAGKNYEQENADISYSTWSLRGQIGWGYAFSRNFHLELLPFLGVGGATVTQEIEDSDDDFDEDGLYVEGGINANLAFTTDGGFQIGGTLGVASSNASFSDQIETIFGTIDAELDVDQTVLTGSIFIGVRF